MWEYVCPECGSSLDPGEKCECEVEECEVNEDVKVEFCRQ